MPLPATYMIDPEENILAKDLRLENLWNENWKEWFD